MQRKRTRPTALGRLTPSTCPSTQADRESKDAELAPEALAQWADAIALGQAGFPVGLSGTQLESLLAEVGRRRRQRLFVFVARAIALDIHREARES
jgi:hypothetical protein